MNGLGNKIRILRYKKGWSQEMFAQKLGISMFVLTQIENDEVDLFYSTLLKISTLLNVPLVALFSSEHEFVSMPESEVETIRNKIEEYKKYADQLQEKYDEMLKKKDSQ